MPYGDYTRTVFTGFNSDEVSSNVLANMRNIIIASAKNPDIIAWARLIVSQCGWKDTKCELQSIFDYLRAHIRYVHDTLGTEYIETTPVAMKTIYNGQIANGDCDDFTVWSLSLYRAIGYDTMIRAVSFDSGPLSHVYGLVSVNNIWVPVDLIAIRGYVGFEKVPYTQKLDYPI
jgi:transglutaminase superfamily protein